MTSEAYPAKWHACGAGHPDLASRLAAHHSAGCSEAAPEMPAGFCCCGLLFEQALPDSHAEYVVEELPPTCHYDPTGMLNPHDDLTLPPCRRTGGRLDSTG